MAVTQRTRFDELKATGQLPSPNGVALAILRLVESEDTTAQAITQVLQTDPALAGRILKLANSSSLGRSRPVLAVRDAVTHLGTRLVRNLALSFSLIAQNRQGACQAFDYDSFWSHSLAQGVATQAGCTHIRRLAPQEAFTCGLLAQVGRLALATVYPDLYSQVLLQARHAGQERLCELERQHFATDHNEMTAALLDDWGLPEICLEAAQYHEQPDLYENPDDDRTFVLIRFLHLGNCFADICLASDADRPARVRDLLDCSKAFEIPPEEVSLLGDRIVTEWQEWGRLLAIKSRPVPAFADLLEQGRQYHETDSAVVATTVVEKAQDEAVNQPMALIEAEAALLDLNVMIIGEDSEERRFLEGHLVRSGHNVQAADEEREGLAWSWTPIPIWSSPTGKQPS